MHFKQQGHRESIWEVLNMARKLINMAGEITGSVNFNFNMTHPSPLSSACIKRGHSIFNIHCDSVSNHWSNQRADSSNKRRPIRTWSALMSFTQVTNYTAGLRQQPRLNYPQYCPALPDVEPLRSLFGRTPWPNASKAMASRVSGSTFET